MDLLGVEEIDVHLPPRANCFLCFPDPELIYLDGQDFFAMLGLGPITEGYSIISTRMHIPSMLDLDALRVTELIGFTEQVRDRLRPHYGEVVITEHGRVPFCEYRDALASEAHCFHAHRLVFPGAVGVETHIHDHGLRFKEYPDFLTCWTKFRWEGHYIYFERPDGSCLVSSAPRALARQFFRFKVAEQLGVPQLASWKAHPGQDRIEAARLTLIGA